MKKHLPAHLPALLGSMILLGAIALAYALWPTRPPPMDAPTAQLVKFITTEPFESLPQEKKVAYVRTLLDKGFPELALAAVEAKLTEAQRERGIDNATQTAIDVRVGKHLDAWLKLDDKGKREYVRKVVHENPSRPPGPGVRPGARDQKLTPEQVKRFIENTSPDRRAALAEFMAAVRKEREGTKH